MAHSTLLPRIRTSSIDTREYRGIRLGNHMQALLISDKTTDMSAASLSVAAGNLDCFYYM